MENAGKTAEHSREKGVVGYIMIGSALIGGCLGYGFIWWLKREERREKGNFL